MAQQQKNISIVAPGFAGLNTQDSPVGMDVTFASVAENCVIDRFGRIASRKGLQNYTLNPEVLNSNPIESVFEFITDTGDKYLFGCGDNKIFIQDTTSTFTLSELTLPGAYTITDNNWAIAQLNDKCFFVQAGHQPLVFDPAVSTTALSAWAEEPSGVGGAGVDFSVDGYPNVVHSAFGRLWIGGFDNNSTAIGWSGLLNGENWTTDGVGSLFTAEYWPSGYDKVSAITAHNNFLIIFGLRNILLYNTTSDVTNDLSLQDTIEGIGCISRDSIVPTGTDIMFVDSTGVRGLNRTIQEKSIPLGDLSLNVRDTFQSFLNLVDTTKVKAVFNTEDSFYAVFFPEAPMVYIFDVRNLLPTGAARATQWINRAINCAIRLEDRTTLFCGKFGFFSYENAEDVTLETTGGAVTREPISMNYVTHPLDFDSPATTLLPKQVDVTTVGGLSGTLSVEWAYDYEEPSATRRINKPISSQGPPAFWNSSLFGAGGFTANSSNINQLKYNIWGSGRNIKVGFRSDIEGSPVSIQEIDIQILTGRIL